MKFRGDIEIMKYPVPGEAIGETLNHVRVGGDSVEEVTSQLNDHLAVIEARSSGQGGDMHIAAKPTYTLRDDRFQDRAWKRPLESAYQVVMSTSLSDYLESRAAELQMGPQDLIRFLVELNQKNSPTSS